MGRVANPARGLLHSLTPFSTTAIARNNRTMHDFFMPQVNSRLNLGAKDERKHTIVDLALRQFDEDGKNKGQKPDGRFFNELLSNLKAFVFAGHDTTASSICWMFKNLEEKPETLARMREEHNEILGPDVDKAHEVILKSPHLLYALPYTLAVIKETLRMYPLISSLREGRSDFHLTIPGTSFQYPTYGFAMWDGAQVIQMRSDIWPRGLEFLPERWLAPAVDPLHPPKEAWRPFAAGPRTCIGQELAVTELRLVAVLVARKFDIQQAWREWDAEK